MDSQRKTGLSRSVMVLLGVGLLAGGSLAAVVTHQVITRRAVLVTDDGTRYEVELSEMGDGASGTFIADDGSVYGIDVVEGDGQREVTVDIDSVSGGTTTVELPDGSTPRVLTEPGQEAQIRITETIEDDEGGDGDTGDGSGDE